MNPTITFYTYHLAPFAQPVEVILIEKGLPFERVEIDVKRNKPAWFDELSPTSNIPILKVDETVLFESRVICEYLDEAFAPAIHPQDPLARAYHRAWMAYGDLLLQDIFEVMIAPTEEALQKAISQYDKHLDRLEQELNTSQSFGPSHRSMVDICFVPLFVRQQLLEEQFGLRGLKAFPHIRKWSDSILARPSTQQATSSTLGKGIKAWLTMRDTAITKAHGR